MSSSSFGRCTIYGTVIFVASLFILMWTRQIIPSFVLTPQVADIKPRRIQNYIIHQNSSNLETENPFNSVLAKNGDTHFKRVQDVSSLHTRFAHLTAPSCDNTCQANHTHCEAKTIYDWLNIINKKTLNSIPLFSKTEYFFPWELHYLKTPPLDDVKNLPSLKFSKIHFLQREDRNGRTNLSSVYSNRVITLAKNIPATFRVDLVDGYGRVRGIGGDEVRAWLKGKTDGPTPEEVRATAKAKDLGNGSYEVIVTPAWTGIAQLNIAVAYPREYIRATVHHFRIGVHRFIFGKFKRDNVEEVTLCHSTPNVPGRQCVCNMTYVNSLPYYCGRPLDTRLSCADWVEVNSVSAPGFKDMTFAETQMDNSITRPPTESLIQSSYQIQIKEGNKDATLPPCRYASRRTSWTMTSPRGVWSKDKTLWNSLICQEPPMTSEWVHNCLKSTTVWMIGDSNMRKMAIHLSKNIGCADDRILYWASKAFCRNDVYNITLEYRPHEYPLYVPNSWHALLDSGPVIDTISSIPSTGDHILVIHYYLHFSSSHLNVLLQRLRTLKTAISSLLSRNPKVLIGIRGPHTSAVEWESNHMFGGDVLGTFIRQIYLDIFRDLQDSVVFLDGWDMSISFENLHFHPPVHFVQALWRTFLAYKCE